MSDAPTPQFILHVGMGKTGTTAIQTALARSAEALARQNARHLGGHFTIDGRPLTDWNAIVGFFDRQTPEALAAAGEAYADALDLMMEAEGLDTVVISSEALLGRSGGLILFLAPLAQRIRVRVMAWARDPAGWLPSAYAQWGVRHKTAPGKVEPYPARARVLINDYRALLDWQAGAPQLFELRPYRRDTPIVAEFSAATGLALTDDGKRLYERPQPAELVLRALFNSGLNEAVLPEEFERAVAGEGMQLQPFDKLVHGLLDYSETAQIVAENAALFDRIAAETGLELRSLGETPPEMPALPQVRKRLVDHLTAITLDQARRIDALERRLAELESRLSP